MSRRVNTYRVAPYVRAPLARFFALSVVVHLLILFAWPKAQIRQKPDPTITVSLLPAPEDTKAKSSPATAEAARGTSRGAVLFTKKISPRLEEKRSREATGGKEPVAEARPNPTSSTAAVIAKKLSSYLEEKTPAPKETMIGREPMPNEPSLPSREPVPDDSIVAKNSLPSIQDILPRERRIPLGTQEPRYANYLEYVRRAIDFNWEYPELAVLYGLHGKLLVEFTILSSGKVEFLTLVRSSGSTLLDEEALRAIRAAAPFPRIPPSVNANRLLISASMEYHDGRLKYRLAP
jgi:TonB family protein